MKVTAVISTCKRAPEYLRRSIGSVLSQDYRDIELFIVDDSPNDYILRDDVMRLCKQFENDRVKYIRNEKQMGACATRNRGAAAGTGEYIAFLDDDDFWCDSKISKQVSVLERYPEYGMVYSDFILINENTGKAVKNSDKNIPYNGNIFDDLMASNFIGSTSIPLMRRRVFEEAGRFDPEQPAMQDWDLWLRIARRHKIGYIPECLVKYYIHTGDHITKSPQKRRLGLERIDKKNSVYLDENPHLKGEHYYYLMRLNIAEHNLVEALNCYKTMIHCKPANVVQNIVRLKSFGRLFIKPSNGWS